MNRQKRLQLGASSLSDDDHSDPALSGIYQNISFRRSFAASILVWYISFFKTAIHQLPNTIGKFHDQGDAKWKVIRGQLRSHNKSFQVANHQPAYHCQLLSGHIWWFKLLSISNILFRPSVGWSVRLLVGRSPYCFAPGKVGPGWSFALV
jgi:hypothetical protein